MKLDLKLPDLATLDFNPELNSHVLIFGIKTIKRTRPVTNVSIKKLIDWTISLNLDELINVKSISSKYEIERIICGITAINNSIPINEI